MAFDPDQYLQATSQPSAGGFDPDAYLISRGKPEDRGTKVYDEPIGPEQASAFDRFKERVKDPARWQAIWNNTGPYAKDVAAGSAPLVVPAGALGAFGKAAVALGEGQGLGYAAGRTALATGQGAAMSALDGKEGESWQDKIDRMKSGAKLSGGIQLAAESVPYVGKALGYVSRKIGQTISGVDENLIENYAKRTDQVNDIIKQSGGDMTAAADQVRGELSSGIQKTKQSLNSQISAALDLTHDGAEIPAKPILDSLEAAKSKLNPNYKAGAISDIDEMINRIKAQAGDSGMLTRRGLYETKQYLNQSSSSAYNKGGQIFTRASEAARAAKDAANEARAGVKEFLPEIAEADAQLSKLHTIEGRLNKNLLAAGKPDGALMAAGTGTNARNAANLRELERISGVPVMQRAKDLATAREFANPKWIPTDSTGKTMARMAVGAGVGGYFDGKEGALVGGALASPMAVKGIVNAANVAGKMGSAVGIPQTAQFIRQNPLAAQTITQLGARQIDRANTDNPMLRGTPPQDQPAPPTLMQNQNDVNRTPAKGEAAWAQSGMKKLGINDRALQEKLMADPKARRLLIEASDLRVGSPAMKKIQDQIKRLGGSR